VEVEVINWWGWGWWEVVAHGEHCTMHSTVRVAVVRVSQRQRMGAKKGKGMSGRGRGVPSQWTSVREGKGRECVRA
jgi:hypothetical protein